jgi:hypothetical protein
MLAGVEKDLAVRAAQYTGKAKLDLLQSGLLKKAAADHAKEARKLRDEVCCLHVNVRMCVPSYNETMHA